MAFKTTFHVDFLTEEPNLHQGYARLEVELPFAPTSDIEFEHPAWFEPRKPAVITYNLDLGTFHLVFRQDRLKVPEHVPEHADMYKLYGWTLSESLGGDK